MKIEDRMQVIAEIIAHHYREAGEHAIEAARWLKEAKRAPDAQRKSFYVALAVASRGHAEMHKRFAGALDGDEDKPEQAAGRQAGS